jgi:hypothetical protein
LTARKAENGLNQADPVALSDEEEAGLIAALKSAETRVLSHDEVMGRAKKLVGG